MPIYKPVLLEKKLNDFDPRVRRDALEALLRDLYGIDQDGNALPPRPATKLLRPKLRDVLVPIFTQAGKPLRVPEILAGMAEVGFVLRSANPARAVAMKLYADKTFKTVGRGLFALRAWGSAGGDGKG